MAWTLAPTEFPEHDPADLPPMPAGFEDTSWHNDMCPSATNEALGIRVWVEHKDPERRENAGPVRYILDEVAGACPIIEMGDDWDAIVRAIDARR